MMVTIEKDEIKLNSRMEELNFSKTNYDSVVTQKGILAVSKNADSKEYNFSFDGWAFSDIKSFDLEGHKNPIVFYCGKNPLSENAKTLLDYSKTENFFDIGFAVCALMTQAAKENITLPAIGAGGIIVDVTKETTSILFLPEDLFKFSVAGMSEEDYSSLHAHWLNSSIYDLPSLCFERAVIAYKMITNCLPYPTLNQLERNADFLDHNFIPVELYCKKIDSQLSTAINKGLKLNANIVNIPGKKKTGKSSEDLTPSADFPLELLKEFGKSAKENLLPQEEFLQKTEEFSKKQKSKVQLKRKVRRNKTAIVVSVIAFIAAIIIVRSMVKSNQESYTSKGLTSIETIQAYYFGVNQKESILLDDFAKGGNTRHQNDAVSNIYVVGKMRQNYQMDTGFLSPGRWLFHAGNEEAFYKAGLYGVTGLTIDGTLYGTHPDIATKGDNPPALTTENGMTLTNNQTITHQVKYNLLYTIGEVYEISLEEITGTITLTYKKDRWVITNFDLDSKEIKVDTEEFKKDYFKALEENDMNVLQAVVPLREKYTWLPDDETINFGANEIIKEQEYLVNAASMQTQPEQ